MEQRLSEKSRFAMVVVATTVVVLLWGFGVELVLQNYIFVFPPENVIRKINWSPLAWRRPLLDPCWGYRSTFPIDAEVSLAVATRGN
jgi:hypothetical protein